ncbi:hypothetical protein [Denitromonas iodatirespirans]|uniref:Uncharacterized protein n=1 Tax=Denitromonas iodatirespirans TaxID=2795389 RepID=A0A944H946_DENI1|nr:hypothetical protein [Denitromonas iodatirespirans]MBT0962050.1 hypothetical protein [Denitromonas iodatirespirans]
MAPIALLQPHEIAEAFFGTYAKTPAIPQEQLSVQSTCRTTLIAMYHGAAYRLTGPAVYKQEFRGWSLRWAHIKQLPAWIWDGYPVFLPIALMVAHLSIAYVLGLGDGLKQLNRVVAAALQIFGVMWIVKSIDSNLRLFKLRPMKERLATYLRRIPLRMYSTTVYLKGANLVSRSGFVGGRISQSRSGQSLEERMAALEGQINSIYARFDDEQRATDKKLSDLRTEVDRQINDVATTTKNLEESIKKQSDDDVGDQIMGMLWIVHAAIAGMYT